MTDNFCNFLWARNNAARRAGIGSSGIAPRWPDVDAQLVRLQLALRWTRSLRNIGPVRAHLAPIVLLSAPPLCFTPRLEEDRAAATQCAPEPGAADGGGR